MPEDELTFEQKVARARAEHDQLVHEMTPQISMPPPPPPAVPRRRNPLRPVASSAEVPAGRATTAPTRRNSGEAAAVASAWAAFLAADEASDAVRAHGSLLSACGVPDATAGRDAFYGVHRATLASPVVPHRTKSLVQGLLEHWTLRPQPRAAARLLISGAGPVGLRAAVEAAVMGMSVTVIERRVQISRVNILTLWAPTAEDLAAYGAHTFYSRFSTASVGSAPLHLGTREIQLVLLKNALLFGVKVCYGEELIGLQPATEQTARDATGFHAGSSYMSSASPRTNTGTDGVGDSAGSNACSDISGIGSGGGWLAWWRPSASTETHQTADGTLAFKPLKTGEYSTGIGQGRCNLMQTSGLDPSLIVSPDQVPSGDVSVAPLDALILAEGEWSDTCKRLGIEKSVDRFTQAIGLVLNLVYDHTDPRTDDNHIRSMYITPLDPVGRSLLAAGIDIEFGEYLKGATHYIAMTVTHRVSKPPPIFSPLPTVADCFLL
jgi:hypothetical protein